MRKSILLILSFVILGIILIFAVFRFVVPKPPPPFQCKDPIGCVDIAPGEPIKLAVLQTLSGGASPGGTEQARTIELAITKRNNQLLGHPIELRVEDERCSPEGGANAALRVIADPQVVGILGTNCSGAAVTAGKIMSKAGLVMISSANTAPSLTSVGGERGANWYPGYFRTSWNDTAMGRAAATFASKKLVVSKAAIIHAGDAYTKGLADVFRQVFTELGGEIVLETTVREDDPYHGPMLTAVALSGAELMYFPLSQPEKSANIVRQAEQVEGLDKLIFIGGEGMISDVFIESVGAAGVGVFLPGPAALKSASNDALRSEYKAKYGEPPPSFYHSFAYDAVNLLLNAIASVAIKEKDGTLHIGRQALRNALYGTTDFQGLTGTLSCDEFGDCGVANLNIVRLDDPIKGVQNLRTNIVFTYTSDDK